MRRPLIAAIVFCLGAVLSCSDMPTAPQPSITVTVTGVITDRGGAPMADVNLAFRTLPRAPGQPFAYVSTLTRSDGSFQVPLAEGSYEVRIAPSYLSGVASTLVPKFDVSRTASTFNYQFTGTLLSGDITGPGGAPFSNALLQINSYSGDVWATAVPTNGHYSVLVPPGNYNIGVGSTNYESGLPRYSADAHIGVADTTIDFALTGNVVTASVTLRGSMALAGAQVSAQSQSMGISAAMRTDLNGTAVLYLPAATYLIAVVPPLSNIVGPEQTTLTVGSDLSLDVDFAVIEWRVTIRRQADNAVLPFLGISAEEQGISYRYANTTSDANGAFTIMVRPGAPYLLHVTYLSGGGYNVFTVANVSSNADSTFDLLVNIP